MRAGVQCVGLHLVWSYLYIKRDLECISRALHKRRYSTCRFTCGMAILVYQVYMKSVCIQCTQRALHEGRRAICRFTCGMAILVYQECMKSAYKESFFSCSCARCITATHCNTLQHSATHCNTSQRLLLVLNAQDVLLQHTATHCHTLPHTATHCHTLPHTAIRCHTLPHKPAPSSRAQCARYFPASYAASSPESCQNKTHSAHI